jgi:L-threonylcarbamoyladenylate synthase
MILKDNRQTRAEAATLIKAGGICAFRTDTFYGLGADPFQPRRAAKTARVEGREDGKPILLVIGDTSEVARFSARGGKLFDAISARHWPGALTLVVGARRSCPEELTAGTETIGLRLPSRRRGLQFRAGVRRRAHGDERESRGRAARAHGRRGGARLSHRPRTHR